LGGCNVFFSAQVAKKDESSKKKDFPKFSMPVRSSNTARLTISSCYGLPSFRMRKKVMKMKNKKAKMMTLMIKTLMMMKALMMKSQKKRRKKNQKKKLLHQRSSLK